MQAGHVPRQPRAVVPARTSAARASSAARSRRAGGIGPTQADAGAAGSPATPRTSGYGRRMTTPQGPAAAPPDYPSHGPARGDVRTRDSRPSTCPLGCGAPGGPSRPARRARRAGPAGPRPPNTRAPNPPTGPSGPPADPALRAARSKRPGPGRGRPPRSAVLAFVSVTATVIGLSVDEDGRQRLGLGERMGRPRGPRRRAHVRRRRCRSSLSLTAAPRLAGRRLRCRRARRCSGCCSSCPAAGRNTSLAPTIGAAAGIIAAWVAPGRDTGTGDKPPRPTPGDGDAGDPRRLRPPAAHRPPLVGRAPVRRAARARVVEGQRRPDQRRGLRRPGLLRLQRVLRAGQLHRWRLRPRQHHPRAASRRPGCSCLAAAVALVFTATRLPDGRDATGCPAGHRHRWRSRPCSPPRSRATLTLVCVLAPALALVEPAVWARPDRGAERVFGANSPPRVDLIAGARRPCSHAAVAAVQSMGPHGET